MKDTGYTRLINYEGRKKELENKLKTFEADVRSNWKYGNEDQHEMLKGMVELMKAWCKDIFKFTVEERVEKEFVNAHRSPICMKGVAQKLRESNTRAEFETEDWYEEYEICGSDGRIRYKEDYASVLLFKLWRDILLTAIDIRGKTNEKFVTQIIPAVVRTKKEPKYGYRGGADLNLWHILRPDGDTTATANTAIGTGPDRERMTPWDDGWHSEGMKAALPRLYNMVENMVPEANQEELSE